MIQYSKFSIQGLHRQLFFLLLLLFPTQLGYHFWPEWAHILGRRIDYLSPTLYVTDVLIVFIIVLFCIERFARIRNHESGIRRKTIKQCLLFSFIIRHSLFIILFVTFVAANILHASSPPVAVYKWLKVLELAGFGWYVLKNRYRISDIGFPLAIGVLYSSVLAIAHFVLQRSVGWPLWILGERTFTPDTPGIARFYFHSLFLRPYATFPHPNVLGGFMATLLPLILYQYTKHKHILYPVAFATGIIALALSCSRSAWMAGGAVIVYMIARMMKHTRPFLASKTGISGIIHMIKRAGFVIFILLYSVLMIQVVRTVHPTDESVVRRTELNQAAITMWRQSPFFGVGLGNYLGQLPKVMVSRSGNFLQPVHNIYLLILAETGSIGLMMFAWLIGGGLRGFWDVKGIMGRALLGTLLLLGLVDHYPITLQQGQLLLALFLVLSYLRR